MFEAPIIEDKKIDALKSEHLREGVLPIFASINDYEEMDDVTRSTIQKIRTDGDFADYYENTHKLTENWMLNAGSQTYVISNCNENNKWSSGYMNCTGIAIVGIDKETGKEISLLSHQDPTQFLERFEENFEEDLMKRIRLILRRTEENTVDVVVFGGHYKRPEEHEKSINKISEICKNAFGFEPVVLTGPSLNLNYSTEAYLDTQNRRLYLIRPPQPDNITNQSYRPSDIAKEKVKWTK